MNSQAPMRLDEEQNASSNNLIRSVLLLSVIIVFITMIAFIMPLYGEDSLLVLYHFNEGSGTVAFDDANYFDGILKDTTNTDSFLPQWVTGIDGYGLEFDGTCGYVEVTHSDTLNLKNDFTLEAWVWTDVSTVNTILCKSWWYYFGILWGYLNYTSNPGGYSISSSSQLGLGKWHHVAVTVSGDSTSASVVLYVDGVRDTSDSIGVRVSNDYNWWVGAYQWPYTQFWDGKIDEVSIYKRALDSLEIMAHYVQNQPVELILYYPFSEDSGTTTENAAGDDYDGILIDADTTNDDGNTPPQWVSGINDSALVFDGTDDYVEISNSEALNLTNNFTLEAWILTEIVSVNTILCKSYEYQLGLFYGHLSYFSSPGPYHVDGATLVSIGEWHHVAVTVRRIVLPDADTLYDSVDVYLDGILEGSGIIAGSDPNGLAWWVGAYPWFPNTQFWDGKIDNVSIYKGALDPLDILAHYIKYRPPEIMARYHFGEGIGGYTFDAIRYGNDGKISGATWTSGDFGSVLSYDGSNDWVEVKDNPTLHRTHGITVDAWIKPKSVPGLPSRKRTIVHKDGLNLYVDAYGYLCNNTTIKSNTQLLNDTLYRITYTEDSDSERIFINAKMDKCEVSEFSGINDTLPLCIGKNYSTSNYYKGTIDEMTIYGRALSKRELKPDTIFYASFDSTVIADTACGNTSPCIDTAIEYDPNGIKGPAILAAVDNSTFVLAYSEPLNLYKPRGTVEFWIKPAWNPELDTNEAWLFRPFFWEQWIGDTTRTDAINIFQATPEYIHFALRDEGKHYQTPDITQWNQDEWHHLSYTWDSATGHRAYIDGEYCEYQVLNFFANYAFTPRTYDTFYVGCSDYSTSKKANASIDELCIYDGVLERNEINKHYRQLAPIDIYARHSIFKDTTDSVTVKIVAINKSDTQVYGELECSIDSGIPSSTQDSLAPGDSMVLDVSFTPSNIGSHYAHCTWSGSSTYKRTLRLYVIESGQRPSPLQLGDTLICSINCESEDTSLFCETASCTSTYHDGYRETDTTKWSRFAYRFDIDSVNQPHLIVVKYPDDKMRTMGIDLCTPNYNLQYDIQTGVFTGGEYPTTDSLKNHEILFWPRDTVYAIIFTNWLPYCAADSTNIRGGAAACSIRIYRVKGNAIDGYLPNTSIIIPEGESQRLLGLWWEDAMLYDVFGGSALTIDNYPWHHVNEFYKNLNNMVDYLKYTGHNLITYPIYMYVGPQYPSQVECHCSDFRINTHPYDWVDMILQAFEAESLRFVPSFSMMAMRSLEELSQFECISIANRLNRIHDVGFLDIHEGPLYNPLHPQVQQRILALVDEILNRYGSSPAFKGLSVNLWGNSFFWFGSLNSGYDDYSYALYKSENPQSYLPDYVGHHRFSQRYYRLTSNANDRQQWVTWRCKKILGFLRAINEELHNKRSDLKLFVDGLLPYPSACSDTSNYRAWYDLNQWDEDNPYWVDSMYKNAGLDLDFYDTIPGIVIEKISRYSMYRERLCLWNESQDEAIKSREIFYDSSYYIPFVNDTCNKTAAVTFNGYFEVGISQIPTMDSFWWNEIGWRANAITPGHKYFMEHYALPMARFDPIGISNGGGTVGIVGHESKVQAFAKAYRALPARKDSIVKNTDTLIVREYRNDDPDTVDYFHIVNKISNPITVRFCFSKTDSVVNVLKDLVDGSTYVIPDTIIYFTHTDTLTAYELHSYLITGSAWMDIDSVMVVQ